ncbi:MAG: hypothetical protein DWQ44_11480 [Bacteroidetes bacterium]|nr:MAG: hypothetical protein DWQ33_09600 [Bacteroidota bacterium]REK05242.1 MAG: hypothetical protein DWQ39_08610 [Bacteroidota bacterium]REK32647.1 MAG: hypothetical protein DWQ44_11480 [Bacteroidota bacterium]REK48906.1 MAG: hypothetical protein DWQ48_08480 [Bacteroidota bacterium]
MIARRFYIELGKLLYAIADIDGAISEKERIALKQSVKDELLPLENYNDEYGTDLAYYTEFEFDFLDENRPDPETALDSFLNFIQEYKYSFDDKLKNVCMKLSTGLASSFHGINSKEKKLLDRVKSELDSL